MSAVVAGAPPAGAAVAGAPLGVAPMHALPWYFGVTVFVIWAAVAIGFGLLVRRRIRARGDERRQPRRRSASPSGPVRDDRSLGAGTDVERRRH